MLQPHTTWASGGLLEQPLHRALKNLAADVSFRSSCPARVPLEPRAWEPLARAYISSSHLVRAPPVRSIPEHSHLRWLWLLSSGQSPPWAEHPGTPWLAPISASAVLPGCPACRVPRDTLACTHSTFSCFACSHCAERPRTSWPIPWLSLS